MDNTYYQLCSDLIDVVQAKGRNQAEFSNHIMKSQKMIRQTVINDAQAIKNAAEQAATDKGVRVNLFENSGFIIGTIFRS